MENKTALLINLEERSKERLFPGFPPSELFTRPILFSLFLNSIFRRLASLCRQRHILLMLFLSVACATRLSKQTINQLPHLRHSRRKLKCFHDNFCVGEPKLHNQSKFNINNSGILTFKSVENSFMLLPS